MTILFSILASIVTSSGFAAVISYRLNATKEQLFFMRQKIEDLYLSIEYYDRKLGAHYISAYPLLKGEISYNEFFDIQNNNAERNPGSGEALEKITMLISVYFPKIKPSFDKYIASRDATNQILADHKRAYKRGNTAEDDWFSRFHEAMVANIEFGEELKELTLAEARNLASEKRFRPWPNYLS